MPTETSVLAVIALSIHHDPDSDNNKSKVTFNQRKLVWGRNINRAKSVGGVGQWQGFRRQRGGWH